MEHLPPPSSHKQDLSKEKPFVSIPMPPQERPTSQRIQRKRYSSAGWIFWALLFSTAGFGMGYLLIPHTAPDTVAQILGAHLPLPDTPLSIVFLRLFASSVPAGLLLCSAALTGFSGTLISLVLCLRGFIEGFTVYTLTGVITGNIPCAAILFPKKLLLFFALWTALRWGIRLCLAVSARRTATEYFFAGKDTPAAMRPLLMRHLAYSLGGFLVAAVGCLAYSICLLHFV